MIGNLLFRRAYVMTILTIVVFILLGSFMSRILIRFSNIQNPQMSAAFFAHAIEEAGHGDRLEGFKKAESWRDEGFPMDFQWVDSSGKILFPENSTTQLDWDHIKKPVRPYETRSESRFGPGPGGGPRSEDPPPHPHFDLVRFGGEPAQYLLITFNPHRGGHPPKPPVVALFGSLAVSILLGVGVALYLFFRSLQDKAVLADQVIAELQKGNLKARFPIGKMDEIGRAMQRFNLMADEIERLVEHLRSVERSRISLLQELAHDLRTPIASLRSLLETIQIAGAQMETKVQAEMLGLAQKETEYFERLVEDLLVLAQVSDPKYQSESQIVNLNDLLEDESQNISAKCEAGSKKCQLDIQLPSDSIEVHGDFHLLRRMFRNALENAFSFANSKVGVTLELRAAAQGSGKVAHIVISDDGSGFTAEALQAYGERRVSRLLESKGEGRVSVGLGSVIIKTVARIHRGSVEASNRTTSNQVAGADIIIELPVSS